MGDLWTVGALLVAGLFLAASILKLSALPAFREELADCRVVPERSVRALAPAIALAEFLGAIGSLIPATRPAGLTVLLALLLVFTGAVAHNLAIGRKAIRCACFGRHSQTLHWGIPLRNLALATACAGALVSAPEAFPPLAAWVVVCLAVTLLWLPIEAFRMYGALRSSPR